MNSVIKTLIQQFFCINNLLDLKNVTVFLKLLFFLHKCPSPNRHQQRFSFQMTFMEHSKGRLCQWTFSQNKWKNRKATSHLKITMMEFVIQIAKNRFFEMEWIKFFHCSLLTKNKTKPPQLSLYLHIQTHFNFQLVTFLTKKQ